MSTQFLFEQLDSIKKAGLLTNLPRVIESGISPKFDLRPYQLDAFKYFVSYYENNNLTKNKQIHTLFHMATGSGKTLIMAGIILYLYSKGYRDFLFFVDQTNILEKTKENFTNPKSSKYLFNQDLEFLGKSVDIKIVDNFSGRNLSDDIQICFTTTQKLHMDLFEPKENTLTFEDFEDNKIVFISDESHHVNTMTKKKTKDETLSENSWEYSVNSAFSMNKDNILLEFTATADLKDKNVEKKYFDKIIFDYPLSKFRESGYTKDFQNFATDSDLWNRALISLIMSEYRRYLFSDLKLNIKPVILMKSQKIKDSEEFYDEFFKKIKTLSSEEILKFKDSSIEVLQDAINYFEKRDKSLDLLKNSIISSFTIDTSIIMNGSSDNSKDKQLLVNSLEDVTNPIRVIFAVDMLNEGWDVLNLYDIVRLYDTRQSSGKAGKIGAYTIREAQLIGRGARYCPFSINDDQPLFKRKYDSDLDNIYRILETMYFHSKNDSRYINELKDALIATGLQPENPIELNYIVKEDFKKTDFYEKSFIFHNKRLPKSRNEVRSMEASMKTKTYRFKVDSLDGRVTSLFEDNISRSGKELLTHINFHDIDYHILLSASESFNALRFDVLSNKYPNLSSVKHFLTHPNFLGNSVLEIVHYLPDVSGNDIFKACKYALEKVSSHILSLKQEFIGSTEFFPVPLKNVIKDKKINLQRIVPNGGKGDSQTNCTNLDYKLDLSEEEWYIFNDNYGTNEEKLFIKYFKSSIEPKLKQSGLEYYVVRNETVSDIAIYSFEHGERFEPDFLLLTKKKDSNQDKLTQLYIEPKGPQFLYQDKWKEDFLETIQDNFTVNNILTSIADFNIIGLPFFNSEERMQEFEVAITEWLNTV